LDPSLIEPALQFVPPLLFLAGTYLCGSMIEKAHYRQLCHRERVSQHFPVVTFQSVPSSWTVRDVELVTGSVVISIDYFKRFLAGLRMIFGGPVKSYETLLDRGRREAIMRLKEEARRRGACAVINVRLETARLASARKNGKGTAGIEVLAFGTALKLAR
jgi:uncharacterized protein YbjQ (UPF0145 family)